MTCAVIVAGAVLLPRVLPWISGVLERHLDARLVVFGTVLEQHKRDLEDRTKAIERDLEMLPLTWKGFQDEVKRLGERGYFHVRRARKELQESGYQDAQLDHVAGELQQFDGTGGAGEGLRILPEEVAEHSTHRVPDGPPLKEHWKTRTLRYKHG